jgi:hypothetical protein
VSLEKLAKLEPSDNGKFVGLTNIITDHNVFIDAYKKIKSRPGQYVQTMSWAKLWMEDIDQSCFDNTLCCFKNKMYKFRPA